MPSEVKLIMVGKGGVGKTSLLKRYKDDEFTQAGIVTVGLDFISSVFEHKGDEIHLQIWDTAGQERYFSVGARYFKGSDIAFIAVSAQDPAEKCLKDIQSVLKACHEHAKGQLVYVFVNKIDLVDVEHMKRDWENNAQEVLRVQEQYNIKQFLYVSARSHSQSFFQKIIHDACLSVIKLRNQKGHQDPQGGNNRVREAPQRIEPKEGRGHLKLSNKVKRQQQKNCCG